MPLNSFEIHPRLLNSACPWATTIEDLRTLYNCPYTGAVTIRTSLINGFDHDSKIHQHGFFSPATTKASSNSTLPVSSLNTLGYSPIKLQQYLDWISSAALGELPDFKPRSSKPFIISVTGTDQEVVQCFIMISAIQSKFLDTLCLMMEINLSCPNIIAKPPPAYNYAALLSYLTALVNASKNSPLERNINGKSSKVSVGIKTPPYTYHDQYIQLISALHDSAVQDRFIGCPVSFITATNTLGSSLFIEANESNTYVPAINSANGSGIGGMAGAALHPLSLGNVSTIVSLLREDPLLEDIKVVGVGGVNDGEGFDRMVAVGAHAVGLATALGSEGVGVFEKITNGANYLSSKSTSP